MKDILKYTAYTVGAALMIQAVGCAKVPTNRDYIEFKDNTEHSRLAAQSPVANENDYNLVKSLSSLEGAVVTNYDNEGKFDQWNYGEDLEETATGVKDLSKLVNDSYSTVTDTAKKKVGSSNVFLYVGQNNVGAILTPNNLNDTDYVPIRETHLRAEIYVGNKYDQETFDSGEFEKLDKIDITYDILRFIEESNVPLNDEGKKVLGNISNDSYDSFQLASDLLSVAADTAIYSFIAPGLSSAQVLGIRLTRVPGEKAVGAVRDYRMLRKKSNVIVSTTGYQEVKDQGESQDIFNASPIDSLYGAIIPKVNKGAFEKQSIFTLPIFTSLENKVTGDFNKTYTGQTSLLFGTDLKVASNMFVDKHGDANAAPGYNLLSASFNGRNLGVELAEKVFTVLSAYGLYQAFEDELSETPQKVEDKPKKPKKPKDPVDPVTPTGPGTNGPSVDPKDPVDPVDPIDPPVVPSGPGTNGPSISLPTTTPVDPIDPPVFPPVVPSGPGTNGPSIKNVGMQLDAFRNMKNIYKYS